MYRSRRGLLAVTTTIFIAENTVSISNEVGEMQCRETCYN